jgi:hypothetical protein
MKISINNPDSMTVIDSLGYDDLDLSSVASNIHAIQFDTSTNTGHIEYNDGTANEDITSITTYQSIVDAHTTKKTNTETTAASNKTTLEATYGWKREQEYPDIGEQLDALYHAGTFDATMTATIKAVKDKYPKG